MMKQRPGKVQAPEKRPYVWRDLFRQKAQAKFVGTDGSMKLLQSEEGQKKIAEAEAETTAALGYSLEEAQKEDKIEDLFRDLQWSKPEPSAEEKISGETEPEDVM